MKFRAKIGADDIVDSDVILSVLPMVAFSRFGEEKTYHYKAQELRLNAKITIDKTINAELDHLSFFRGRFKEKSYDENLMFHIKKEERQKYADSMIDHYGVERDRGGKINAFELAMKMDLDIETVPLTATIPFSGRWCSRKKTSGYMTAVQGSGTRSTLCQ